MTTFSVNLRVMRCFFSGLSAEGSLLLFAWGKYLFSLRRCRKRIRNRVCVIKIYNWLLCQRLKWSEYYSFRQSPDVKITSEGMFKSLKTETNSVQFISLRKTLKTPFGIALLKNKDM